jgi:hypothetical protein
MFIGHYAAALAAKRAAPEAPLGVLAAAAVGLDLVWPVLVLAGVETVRVAPGITAVTPLDFASYPYSHSLVSAAGWSVAAALLARRCGWTARAALVAGLAVFSHWLLDFVTHRPDLPLAFGDSAKVGLGLWRSVAGTAAVEGGLFAAACAAYLRATEPTSRGGSVGFAVLVAVLLAVYAGALSGQAPPSATAVAASALGQWLFVGAAGWVDARRRPR